MGARKFVEIGEMKKVFSQGFGLPAVFFCKIGKNQGEKIEGDRVIGVVVVVVMVVVRDVFILVDDGYLLEQTVKRKDCPV